MVLALEAIKEEVVQQKLASFSPEVESLRGIASLLVVMGHLYLLQMMSLMGFSVESSHDNVFRLMLSALFDPQPAVLLFFTISGLVLGRQLRKEPIVDVFSFLAFVCRRAFRLIPLMLITTVFAFLLMNSMTKVDPSTLYANLLLSDVSLNIPLWSLKVEICCSICFPIIFLLFELGGNLINLFLFILLSVLSYYCREPLYVQFLIFFHVGLLVDLVSAKASHFVPQGFSFLILCVATAILLLAPEFTWGPRLWGFGYWQAWVFPEILACPLILLVVISQNHSFFNRFLRLPFVRYIGKISFSIYLLHFPLFLYMQKNYLFNGTLINTAVFLLCYLAAVFILSSLSFRLIEVPFNALGKKLSLYVLRANKTRPVLN